LHEIVESHEPIVNVLEKGHGNEAGLLLRSHVEMSLKHLIRGEWDSRPHRESDGNLELVDADTVPHKLSMGDAAILRFLETDTPGQQRGHGASAAVNSAAGT
jgi:hypothetical protein